MNKKAKSRKIMVAASMICDDFKNLKRTLQLFKKGGVDYIHFDVMDGLFVPRFGLFPEFLKIIKSLSSIPVDVHLMVQNPDQYIKTFVDSGADIISIHSEANVNLSRTLKIIKDSGAMSGLVLNPATPLNVLDYVLDDLDLIMIMAINPGIVGQKLIPKTYDKLRDLKSKLDGKKIIIGVDGGVTFESAPRMIEAGANMLVCGTSSIFKQQLPLDIMSNKLRGRILDFIK
jgi:ribulose-phosphate 3-epimerase